VKEDAANNPAAKRQKRDSGEAGSSNNGNGDANGGDSVFVPSRYIAGMVAHHYEVTEILPRLHVLRELLNKSVYEEDEEEHEAEEAAEAEAAIAAAAAAAAAADAEDDEEEKAGAAMSPKRKRNSTSAAAAATPAARPRYTTAHLRQLVQASDAELFAGLDALDAFEDSRGHWRILSPSLSASLLDSILLLTEEKRWAPRVSDLPADEVAEGLKELYPQLVTKQALKAFSKKQTEGSDKNCQLHIIPSCRGHQNCCAPISRAHLCCLYALLLLLSVHLGRRKSCPFARAPIVRDARAIPPRGLPARLVRGDARGLGGRTCAHRVAAWACIVRELRCTGSTGALGFGCVAGAHSFFCRWRWRWSCCRCRCRCLSGGCDESVALLAADRFVSTDQDALHTAVRHAASMEPGGHCRLHGGLVRAGTDA
jgi:hypothetical protein